MSASAAKLLPDAAATLRTPLERLLHALNQPLTGLQCSLEVALAAPRTVEYYEQRLRDGVDLAERMRALVEAIREVVQEETGAAEMLSSTDASALLSTVLRDVVEGLELVAEAKNVRIVIEDFPAFPLTVNLSRQTIASLLFRMIESALTLAEWGSDLRIQTRGLKTGATKATAAEAWIGMRWQGAWAPEFSRPELGLVVAQAGWERAGARWERERVNNSESVTVRFEEIPKVAKVF